MHDGPPTKDGVQYRRPYDADEQIVRILADHGRPMSAYQIRDAIAGRDRPIAPMQVYRTLERLGRAGRVRRIEHVSAYVLEDGGPDMFAICDDCGRHVALALGRIADAVVEALAGEGFASERPIIEARGRCAGCRSGDEGVGPIPREPMAGRNVKSASRKSKTSSAFMAWLIAGLAASAAQAIAVQAAPGTARAR